jgi:hypothetical protein
VRIAALRYLLAIGLIGGLAFVFAPSAGAAPSPSSASSPSTAKAVKPACKKIKGPGTICVGPVTVKGQNFPFMRVTYQYMGSGSVRGYARLGTDFPTSRGCTPGHLVRKGETVTLWHDQKATVQVKMTVDAKWTGTFFHGSSDFGTVCGTF